MPKESKKTQFVPDTNVFIRAFAGKSPDNKVLDRLIDKGRIKLSPVVVAEYLVGTKNERDRELMLDVLESFRVTYITKTTALLAAEYRREFLRKTHPAYLLDCLVAATCKQHGFALVTNNITDFPMEDISILSPEKLRHNI